ncbi:hypothetical protein ACFYPN_11425 [Streptomyces sp. NPDC005576]|uniref:hypothetical protein n=1 Tax=Streptomyces sp. NPDC005576 TaxID=3364726 RepID=UPI00367F0610
MPFVPSLISSSHPSTSASALRLPQGSSQTPGPLSSLVWLVPAVWTTALGLWGLTRRNSMWRDEAATWQVARRPADEIWHMVGNVDVVHAAYYLLMHALFECFGAGITTLRLPSVLATALAAASIAVVGSRLSGARVGLTAGMAFGLLPAVQFYLQEGRPYALVAACAGGSTLLLVNVLMGRDRPVTWIAYGGSVLLGGLLNWLSLLILSAHLVTLLWVRAGQRVWRKWVVVAALAALCVLPLILFSRGQSAQVSWIPPLTWHMLIGPGVLLAIGGAGLLVEGPHRRQLSVSAVGMPLLALPQLILAGLSLVQPLFLDRYVLFSLLGLALLIGSAVDRGIRVVGHRHPRTAPWILPLVILVATMALLPQLLAKRSPASRVDDVLAIASVVQTVKKPGDAVLFLPAARRDTESVSPAAFSGLRDLALAVSPQASGTLKGIEASPEQIRASMLAQRRILLVTDTPEAGRPVTARRDKVKLRVLGTDFVVVSDKQVRGRRVTVYERPARQAVPRARR